MARHESLFRVGRIVPARPLGIVLLNTPQLSLKALLDFYQIMLEGIELLLLVPSDSPELW